MFWWVAWGGWGLLCRECREELDLARTALGQEPVRSSLVSDWCVGAWGYAASVQSQCYVSRQREEGPGLSKRKALGSREWFAGWLCFTLTAPGNTKMWPCRLRWSHVSISGMLLEGGDCFSSVAVSVLWCCSAGLGTSGIKPARRRRKKQWCAGECLTTGSLGGNESWFVICCICYFLCKDSSRGWFQATSATLTKFPNP